MKVQKNHKRWKYILAAVFFMLFMIYIGISFFFKNHFFWGTVINGHDFSGKTTEYAEENMKKQLEDYTLNINGRDGKKDHIKGGDIFLSGQGVKEELDDIMGGQDIFLWLKFIFMKKSYHVINDVFYDEEKLSQKISTLNVIKFGQSSPRSAYLEFNGDEFVVRPETDGTVIDEETLKKKISIAITQLDPEINLEKECYIMPEYTLNSKELQHACQKANKYCQASITYLMDEPVVIDKKIISDWLSIDDGFNVILDENAIRQWLEDFGNRYDTVGITRSFTTPTGKDATVTGGTYGWSVDEDTEYESILQAIKNGDVITKEPAYYFGSIAVAHTMPDWGNTYAEVDLSEQHMWFISNGTVLLDTDVVTGETIPEKITPEGCYSLLEKGTKVVLRGEIVPETGQPEYLQTVNYWMRITWEGIGFHDATWQSAFGGNLNQITGIGSHGCINMPLDQAAALYDMIEVGTPVIIHY